MGVRLGLGEPFTLGSHWHDSTCTQDIITDTMTIPSIAIMSVFSVIANLEGVNLPTHIKAKKKI